MVSQEVAGGPGDGKPGGGGRSWGRQPEPPKEEPGRVGGKRGKHPKLACLMGQTLPGARGWPQGLGDTAHGEVVSAAGVRVLGQSSGWNLGSALVLAV